MCIPLAGCAAPAGRDLSPVASIGAEHTQAKPLVPAIKAKPEALKAEAAKPKPPPVPVATRAVEQHVAATPPTLCNIGRESDGNTVALEATPCPVSLRPTLPPGEASP